MRGIDKMREKDEIHRMELPKTVIIGNKILSKVSEIYGPIHDNIEKLIMISGPNVFKIIEKYIDRSILKDNRIFFAYKASWKEIDRLWKEIKRKILLENDILYVLGIGGGKVIDIAKMMAFKLDTNFVSIPTTPSHDGIASQFVSLRGGGRAYSYITRPPTAIIVDLKIIENAPHRFIASGVGDAIAKITAVRDWRLGYEKTGEYYGEYAANLALLGAKLVKENSEGIGKGDRESIRTLVEALISDGVAAGIAGSSRPCSGSEHLFSHALDLYGKKHALHGEQVGIGTILMSYLHELDYNEIKNDLKKAGAPTNYRELGVEKEDIINALVKAKEIRPERYTVLNEIKMNRDVAESIAKKTEVI